MIVKGKYKSYDTSTLIGVSIKDFKMLMAQLLPYKKMIEPKRSEAIAEDWELIKTALPKKADKSKQDVTEAAE